MVDRVTKTVSSAKQPMADMNVPEYASAIVAVGKSVTAELKVDGITVATLGPWNSKAKAEMNPLARLRLNVYDSCEQKDFTASEVQ